VPYCPHLPHLFFGEEPYMLARMWTRGWDVFAPAVPLAFHQWERAARAHTYQRARSAADEAAREAAAAQRRSSEARVLCVLGCAAAREAAEGSGGIARGSEGREGGSGDADEEWVVGHRWGLGKDRTLEQLAEATGLSFENRQCPTDPGETEDVTPVDTHSSAVVQTGDLTAAD
ncbi:[Skp1-protein]-hydroxyproline N-acetylglucosaminyltransferase, partial [Tetrabaena socialis]